ncbi:MAG: PAS domain S-box protein [Chloroflexi bacterium]|nr:MAG: PAS domain S-box protein [Chloroflexota bacterium]
MVQQSQKILFVNQNPAAARQWLPLLESLNGADFQVEQVDPLPVMSGKVVAKNYCAALLQTVGALGPFTQLRTQMPQLPIIILCEQENIDSAQHALRAGAQDVLVLADTTKTLLKRAITHAIERKIAEAPLIESETRYRALFKNARNVAYITTRDGKFIDVNRAALALFGYRRDEIIGMHVKNLHAHPEEHKKLAKTAANKGTIKDYEVKLKTKAGQILTCLLNLSARRAPDGTTVEYHGFIRNITHRKTLEERWRRYEFIVNNSKEFMTLINHNYVYDAVNDSYCTAHGMHQDDIVGKSVAEVWGEEVYLTKIKPTLDRCFAGEESYFQGWLSFKALGERYMHVTYYPYHNTEGVVSHVVVVSRDVTERTLAEEALGKAHAQNEQLLASIPSILIGVNSDDQITHLNRPAEETFGVKADDVVGRPLLESSIQWDWMEILTRIDEGRKGMTLTSLHDVKYTRADGKEGFLNVIVSPFVGESTRKAGFLLIGQDVTERKVLESQLAQAQKLESIGQLAAGIAHEINTPTQYVGDNIRFLQESFTDLSGLLDSYQKMLAAAKNGGVTNEVVQQVEEAQDEADLEFLIEEIPAAISQSIEGIERVTGIVRAMKEFSHPGVEQKTAIDINKAIESTITVARNEWKYVAELVTDFDPDMPPVPCLPGEFNQAILNMIINATHAIDALDGTGDGPKGTITVQTRKDGNWAEIRVSDTGTGIPEAVRPRIFDPFFTTKGVGQGTGQGLAISHSVIADKHGGTITFETEMGVGTTFIIRLPIELVPANGTELVPAR